MNILVLDGDSIDPEIKTAILRELDMASAGFLPIGFAVINHFDP
jgi:hypothetical protein